MVRFFAAVAVAMLFAVGCKADACDIFGQSVQTIRIQSVPLVQTYHVQAAPVIVQRVVPQRVIIQQRPQVIKLQSTSRVNSLEVDGQLFRPARVRNFIRGFTR